MVGREEECADREQMELVEQEGMRCTRQCLGTGREARLSLKQSIAMVCGDGRVMHQKCCGLHRYEQNGCLGCGVNISMGNEQNFVGTRWAGRAGSRLHDSIVMCSIAPEMVELFKKSECQHWVPIFDIWALRRILGFSLPFLLHFSRFLAHSQGSDDLYT